jgi:hypothetical protein
MGTPTLQEMVEANPEFRKRSTAMARRLREWLNAQPTVTYAEINEKQTVHWASETTTVDVTEHVGGDHPVLYRIHVTRTG